MMRWIWRGVAVLVVLLGWLFIIANNRFYVSAPVVFVCLGYLAVVATVYNLWRTGSSAVASDDVEDNDSTVAKSSGALGELEREKRTLLKAIKEAEFDHQMGKLSQRDVDDMVRDYRARAIEVIKEIDRLSLGAAGTPREQILREVRARVELEARATKKPAAKQAAGAKAKAPKDKQQPAESAAATGPADAVSDSPPPAETAPPDDDSLDADSTTAIESRHQDAAKEAMP